MWTEFDIFLLFFYLQDKVKSCRYCCSPTPIQLPIAALTACALPVYCSRLHVLHNEKSVITARCPCRSTVLPTIECNWLREKSLNSFRRREIVNLLQVNLCQNLESVNPQYDKRLFIEFSEKYKFRTCCVQILFWISKQKNKNILVHNMF